MALRAEVSNPTVDVAEMDYIELAPEPCGDLGPARHLDRKHLWQTSLKHLLKGVDTVAFVAAWSLAFLFVRVSSEALMSAAALAVLSTATALIAMASKRLWLYRVCAVRSIEMERLGEAVLLSGLVTLGAVAMFHLDVPPSFVYLGVVFSLILLIAGRMSYRAWLTAGRRKGRFTRGLVLVGANEETAHLARIVQSRPDNGFYIAGVCGDQSDVRRFDIRTRWLGEAEDADAAIAATDSSGAIVVASAFDQARLNRLLRQLLRTGSHVHVSNGISGIAHGRLRNLPLAHEPLFYLERICLTRPQLFIKRTIDVVASIVLFSLSLPVMAISAVMIKLEDGGPLMFTQLRVGRADSEFRLFKLRTMIVDAESVQHELADSNERTGPLFKIAQDPRVTKVGRILRALSIDELPQLINVLRGQMSLVGPRPALPAEVAQFDDELRERGSMLPGITGLWQVEARDDPSFETYRRLDLFYVENWSVGLDLSILLGTVGAVMPRGIRVLTSRRRFA